VTVKAHTQGLSKEVPQNGDSMINTTRPESPPVKEKLSEESKASSPVNQRQQTDTRTMLQESNSMEIDSKATTHQETIAQEETGILHCVNPVNPSGRTRYNPFYHRKPPAHAPQKPKEDLDKPIVLKQGQKRAHIHRYDMRISAKKTKDEDEEFKVIKAALQKFLDLLLQADESIIIPPFYEIERSDKTASDLSAKFQVSELDSIVDLKRYFARLSKITDKGFVYCNVIIAHSATFFEIMDKLRQIFNDLKFGLYPRASDHEDSADVGWLLYSNKFQDSQRLAQLFSSLVNEKVGVKWKPIHTNERFCKDPSPANPAEPVSAMHIEAAANKAIMVRQALLQWYNSTSKSFPDGTKMRLVPPFQTITIFSHKAKYSALVARQASLSAKIGSASCYEFAANMILDRPAPDTQETLRSYLLSIPSKNFPNTPMFHSVDMTFRSSTGITFAFHPENASHAHALRSMPSLLHERICKPMVHEVLC
jgi:hypothetical protein